jgi:hypothetical protein
MRRRAKQVEANVPKVVREVALGITQTVVSATPVDTGRARSNWQVDIGSASRGVLPAFAAGEGGSTSGANSQAALERARTVIETYDAGDGEIHITNNLPYIARLNEGSSAQAPAGFVEQAVQEAAAFVRGASVIND